MKKLTGPGRFDHIRKRLQLIFARIGSVSRRLQNSPTAEQPGQTFLTPIEQLISEVCLVGWPRGRRWAMNISENAGSFWITWTIARRRTMTESIIVKAVAMRRACSKTSFPEEIVRSNTATTTSLALLERR